MPMTSRTPQKPRSGTMLDFDIITTQRVAQLEDAIEIYGVPPKRKRLPIPEISPAQREFLIWLAVFSVISLVSSQKKRWGSD